MTARRRLLVTVLMLLLLVLLLLWSRGSGGNRVDEVASEVQAAAPSEADMRLCEQIMGLSFPPAAMPKAFFYRAGLDDSVYLKIEMPRESVDALIQNSPFRDMPLSTTERMVHAVDDLSWWTVEDIAHFRSGRVELPGIRFLSILIDMGDGSVCQVYLQWWET